MSKEPETAGPSTTNSAPTPETHEAGAANAQHCAHCDGELVSAFGSYVHANAMTTCPAFGGSSAAPQATEAAEVPEHTARHEFVHAKRSAEYCIFQYRPGIFCGAAPEAEVHQPAREVELKPLTPDEAIVQLQRALQALEAIEDGHRTPEISKARVLLRGVIGTGIRADSDREWQPEVVDEVQRRMDAVVDAAVEWHQDESGDWSQKAEILGDAIDALLELRDAPAPPMPQKEGE